MEPKPPGEVEEVLPVWVEPGEATGQEALPGPALGEEDSVGGRNGAFPDGWHVGRGKTGLRELRRQAERCDETGEGAAAAVARITAAAAERMSKHPVYRAKFGEHGPRDGAGEAARMVWEVELARCTAWWMEKRTGKDEG